jgi:hypothetical protein
VYFILHHVLLSLSVCLHFFKVTSWAGTVTFICQTFFEALTYLLIMPPKKKVAEKKTESHYIPIVIVVIIVAITIQYVYRTESVSSQPPIKSIKASPFLKLNTTKIERRNWNGQEDAKEVSLIPFHVECSRFPSKENRLSSETPPLVNGWLQIRGIPLTFPNQFHTLIMLKCIQTLRFHSLKNVPFTVTSD